MITEILSKIWDYIFNLFGHHNTDNLEKFSKQVRWQSIALIGISVLWGIVLSVLIYRVGINEIPLANEVKNGENILYKPTSYAWGMIIAMLFFVWTVSSYAYGVLKDLKPNTNGNIISDPLKDSLQNDVSFLQLKQCKNCSDYILANPFIVNRIENLGSHSAFVKECCNLVPRANIKELGCIIDFYRNASTCKLICLLTNPQYYTPSSEPTQCQELLDYFVAFFPYKNGNKRIKRVFNLSAVKNSNDGTLEEREKWLFKFVITNIITGVETCLLNDINDPSLKKINVDYVVGLEPDRMNKLFSLRNVFLSYEEQTGQNNVINVNDQLLANLFESDFYDRVKGSSSSRGVALKRNRIVNNDPENADFNDINKFVSLTKNELLDCCDEVNTYIDTCSVVSLTTANKKQLETRIKKIKKAIKNCSSIK